MSDESMDIYEDNEVTMLQNDENMEQERGGDDDDDTESGDIQGKNSKTSQIRTLSIESIAYSFAKAALRAEAVLLPDFTPISSNGQTFSLIEMFPEDKSRVTEVAKRCHATLDRSRCTLGDCNVPFNYKADFLYHLVTEHLIKEEKHITGRIFTFLHCPFSACRFTNTSLANLVEHLCSEIDYRRWKCHICPAAFYCRHSIHSHLKSAHGDEKVITHEEQVDEITGELTGRLDKPTPQPKYSQEELKVTFKRNRTNDLIIPEGSLITNILNKTAFRFIKYKEITRVKGEYRRLCAVNLCVAVAKNGYFCLACSTTINENTPFTTEKPNPLVNLESNPPYYHVLQVTNSSGELMNICSNIECRMRYGIAGVHNTQYCCSPWCLEHVKTFLETPVEGECGLEGSSQSPTIYSKWEWDVNFDSSNNLQLQEYSDSPGIPNAVRLYSLVFDGLNWNAICCVKDCGVHQHTRRLCKPHDKESKSKSCTLKVKPPGHNFQVKINNNNNDIESATYTKGDEIWIREIWVDGKWEKKCANWLCNRNIKRSRGHPIFCREHGVESRAFLPPYQSTRASKYSASQSNSSQESSSSNKKSTSNATPTDVLNHPSTSSTVPPSRRQNKKKSKQ